MLVVLLRIVIQMHDREALVSHVQHVCIKVFLTNVRCTRVHH